MVAAFMGLIRAETVGKRPRCLENQSFQDYEGYLGATLTNKFSEGQPERPLYRWQRGH